MRNASSCRSPPALSRDRYSSRRRWKSDRRQRPKMRTPVARVRDRGSHGGPEGRSAGLLLLVRADLDEAGGAPTASAFLAPPCLQRPDLPPSEVSRWPELTGCSYIS